MIIKYQCKCGCTDMFVKSNGNNIGLYCKSCGKWQKWLSKNEFRAFEHDKSHEYLKNNLNNFIDFLNEEIDRQFEKEPLSAENSIFKCSYATVLERVRESLINIVDGRRYNEYEQD